MEWLKRRVRVTLVDASTGKTIATVKMRSNALPETFEVDTTLHQAGQDWQVVSAEPLRRSEFARTRRLTLVLKQIERMDVNQILYSLPTICNALPQMGQELTVDGDFALHEDDWRQIEFVDRVNRAAVSTEIEAIRSILQNHAIAAGWDAIHVRRSPEPPISGSFGLGTVARLSAQNNRVAGLTLADAPTRVEWGFSLSLQDGLTLYGIAPNGNVAVCGIAGNRSPALSDAVVSDLLKFAETHQLDLVHWCRGEAVTPDADSLRRLLT